MKTGHAVGACAILGLAIIAEFIYFQRRTSANNLNIAWQQGRDQPTEWYDADYVAPVGTRAAPRMFVSEEQGNVTQIQGGRSSWTNSTGRWAA